MERCIDCKFFDSYDGRCNRKVVWGTEPDTTYGGERRIIVRTDGVYRTGRGERASILPWKCGMKGRHFQERKRQLELAV